MNIKLCWNISFGLRIVLKSNIRSMRTFTYITLEKKIRYPDLKTIDIMH